MVFCVFDKIKKYVIKNIKVIFKSIWGIVLFSAGIYYIYHNYARILVSVNIIDYIILAGTLTLAFLPLISEISLIGFSVKKEIQSAKQEMKESLVDLKYQMIDIKATTTQNTTQSIKVEYLPSRDEMKDMLSKTNRTKEKVENEQKGAEIKDEFDISDDIVYLFKVRLKLEKYVAKICDNIGNAGFMPLIKEINILKEKKIITSDTYQYLRQILNICNRGIHGEVISEEYIKFVKEIISQIYSQLDEIIQCQSMKHKYFMICPKCKFSGYSEYENVCPNCGFVSDD